MQQQPWLNGSCDGPSLECVWGLLTDQGFKALTLQCPLHFKCQLLDRDPCRLRLAKTGIAGFFWSAGQS